MKLSVVIPVFNEKHTILEIIEKVRAVKIPKEIILVDDYSTDGTREILKGLDGAADIRVFFHDKNCGKGAALREGFRHVAGDVVVVQDADLEYDPEDYHKLLEPILRGRADVVFGSRFMGGPHRVLFFWHYVANQILTLLSNMVTDLNLTDMETCYKVFRADIIRKLTIEQNRFGFEPEVTAKVARMRCRIYEVPISYWGRDYEEGKKIGLKDAFSAVYCILRYGLFG
ncbi:MAG: glycosyltransferase family 2 protein [Acidobacteria bacterium]|nr:glycosyltransferase family 2 protein [Acidobacteriota bacterium]MBI3656194.1 glycosyltransferase family 2 protein [Acidobacteriota bacterium]